MSAKLQAERNSRLQSQSFVEQLEQMGRYEPNNRNKRFYPRLVFCCQDLRSVAYC